MSDLILPSGVHLHIQTQGPAKGPALVLIHGLGTDQRIWDAVVPLLPKGLHIIRFDLRGHGGSGCPAPPYSMGALVRDAEGLLDQMTLHDCVVVGLGLGGMVAQGLAVKRLDLVRALVLTGTAAKLGQADAWRARAQHVQNGGLDTVAPDLRDRWFARGMRASDKAEVIRARLLEMNPDGYVGGCMAIAGTDFYTPTSGLRLPTLGIAGSEDRAIPPDLQRETVELIPGSQFQVVRRAGHLPCVDHPEDFATTTGRFLAEIGHID